MNQVLSHKLHHYIASYYSVYLWINLHLFIITLFDFLDYKYLCLYFISVYFKQHHSINHTRTHQLHGCLRDVYSLFKPIYHRYRNLLVYFWKSLVYLIRGYLSPFTFATHRSLPSTSLLLSVLKISTHKFIRCTFDHRL